MDTLEDTKPLHVNRYVLGVYRQRLLIAAPTIVVDEVCQGIVSHSFLSTVSYQFGRKCLRPRSGPWMISFLNDGRVIWKYETRSLLERLRVKRGLLKRLSPRARKPRSVGLYSAETDMIRIDDVNYLKATEE